MFENQDKMKTFTYSKEQYSGDSKQNKEPRIELFEVLAKSDEDVKSGRTARIKDTFDALRNVLLKKDN